MLMDWTGRLPFYAHGFFTDYITGLFQLFSEEKALLASLSRIYLFYNVITAHSGCRINVELNYICGKPGDIGFIV